MSCQGRYFVGWRKDTPDTFVGAKATDWEMVKKVFAVEIKNGYYRGSYFNGIFEVSDPNKLYFKSGKGQRVRVKTHWFCCRPTTRWPGILIEHGECTEKPNFSGKVVRNIGQ